MKKLENPRHLFPMFLTKKLTQTKAFYLKAGFQVRFETPQYLQVAYGDQLELCFMKPERDSQHPFPGEGVVISIPTPDADQKAAELRECQVQLANEVEDKPWGWRSFHVADPNGVILDFFHVYKELPMSNESS